MKNAPSLSPPLKRVAALRAEGKSQRATAEILEAEGVPPIGRAKKWSHTGVQAALQQLEAWQAAQADTPAPDRASPPPSEEKPKPATPAQVDIKIQGPWMKGDGLLWEFLLHEVWNEHGPPPTPHKRPISEAARGLRTPSGRQDRAAFCAALDRLARSHVIVSGVWGEHRANLTAALLTFTAGTETVTFQFPAAVLKLVKNPEQYSDLQELRAAKS